MKYYFFAKLTLTLTASLLLAACNSSDSSGGGSADSDGSGSDSATVSAFSSKQYFIGNDGSSGNQDDPSQLWLTDGTGPGTELVKDLFPGDDANLQSLTLVGNKLFFTADDGTGEQLWVTDGTTANTIRLTSNNLKNGSATQLTALGNTLYFRGSGTDESGPRLWRSDGTAAGTELVSASVPQKDGIRFLTAFNGYLYFRGDNGTDGRELWRSDGTELNTQMLVDIPNTGLGGSMFGCVDGLVPLGDSLYFAANANEGEDECALWKTDGSINNADKVKKISDSSNTGPVNLVVSGNQLFFLSGGFSDQNAQIWVSDGTANGTVVVKESDANERIWLDPELPLVATSDSVYFQLDNLTIGSTNGDLELWYSNGTTTAKVQAMDDSVTGDGVAMATVGNYLYYIADRPIEEGDFLSDNKGLWRTSGASRELVHSFSGANGGEPLLPVGDGQTLLFYVTGEDLWRTNGTQAGTVFVKDICPGFCKGFIGF